MKLRQSQPHLPGSFVTDVVIAIHHRFPVGSTVVDPSSRGRYVVSGVFFGAGVTYRLVPLDDESRTYAEFTMNVLDAERRFRLEDQP